MGFEDDLICTADSAFHADYSAALTRANAIDVKLRIDALKISEEYAPIVALSIRQTLAAFEITIPAGTLGTTDAKLFMKGGILLNHLTGTLRLMTCSIRNLQQRM